MGKMQCFISHCSDDREFVLGLYSVLKKYYVPEYDFFNTSKKENAIYAGEGRGPAIRNALNESEVMIAVITDSYLRSTICISEISAFWFENKTIIPLVITKYGAEFLKDLTGESRIHINLTNRDSTKLRQHGEEMIAALDNVGFYASDTDKAREEFDIIFSTLGQATPVRSYIGSREEYEHVNRYCNQFGISRIINSSIPSEELISRLDDYKTIYILSTTGANLIQTLASEYIPRALKRGVDIYVLIPDKSSGFIRDVAEMEAPNGYQEHERRFEREFDGVVYNLRECIRRVGDMSSGNIGNVYMGCMYTMLRQTIILAVNEDRIWGWMSMTLPPKRTVDGTPSFEFSGTTRESSMAGIVYGHVQRVLEVIERRGSIINLVKNDRFESFGTEGAELPLNKTENKTENENLTERFQECESYWAAQRDQAMRNSLLNKGRHHLIEVAAQHPLLPNGDPDVEFAARLDRAVWLYHELVKEDPGAKIYVPGSIHCYKGEPDVCSLSEAGRRYLIRSGIPENAILGEDENKKYKGEDGVYNTADECYVASRIFNNGNYKRLHCVCSPNQIIRKKLFYMVFGLMPFFYTVSTDEMAHDDIYELFHSVPNILMNDHDWQGKDSKDGNRTRRERDPRYL